MVLASGTIAGLLLFFVQRFTTFPLIQKAEVYEEADAQKETPHAHEHGHEAWQPADGTERTLYTVVTTTAAGIGFALVFWGAAGLSSFNLNMKRGMLWGCAAFLCVNVAPSLGLPPQPPGVPVAPLYSRQLWWIFVVGLTAVGLWLLLKKGNASYLRALGGVLVIVPHLVKAPIAMGTSSVPPELIHQFAVDSILSMGFFWLTLGGVSGLLGEKTGLTSFDAPTASS